MPRSFNDTDRSKKKNRITLPENVAGLSTDQLARLENIVKDSLVNGYLPCATAHKIAGEYNIPVVAVGQVVDKTGHRITGCQIGCFKVEKTSRLGKEKEQEDTKIVEEVEALYNRGELTCAAVFELARRYNVKPLTVADIANSGNMKIKNCQLGCF